MTYAVGDIVLYTTGHERVNTPRFIGVIIADEKHIGPKTDRCYVWFAKKGEALDEVFLNSSRTLRKVGHISDAGCDLDQLRTATDHLLRDQPYYWK